MLVRASFGVRGANVPAVLRALVACGWFGIQTWIGGQAIHSMLKILWPAAVAIRRSIWVCFFAFWLLNMCVIWRGIETIRFLEGIGAPFMLGVGVLLLWWITQQGRRLRPGAERSCEVSNHRRVLALLHPVADGDGRLLGHRRAEIPDFTRYARSQKAQMLGQALGLPTAMTLYSFIGVAVTSASVVLFGEAIWDPVVLIGRFNQPVDRLHRADRHPDRDAQHERRGQRRLAVQRFLEPQPAADFVPHRRADHRRHRRADDAVEAAERLRLLHFRMAGRILRAARPYCRRHDCRLLHRAPAQRSIVDDLYRRGGAYEYSNGVNPRALISLGLRRCGGAARAGDSGPALAVRLRLVRRFRVSPG